MSFPFFILMVSVGRIENNPLFMVNTLSIVAERFDVHAALKVTFLMVEITTLLKGCVVGASK